MPASPHTHTHTRARTHMRAHTPLPPLPSHAWQRPLSNVKRGELPLNTLPHRLYCRPAGCAFTDSNSEANLTAPCKPYYITAYLRTQYVGTWFLSKATYKTIHNIRMDHFQSGDIYFHVFTSLGRQSGDPGTISEAYVASLCCFG